MLKKGVVIEIFWLNIGLNYGESAGINVQTGVVVWRISHWAVVRDSSPTAALISFGKKKINLHLTLSTHVKEMDTR